MLMPSWMLFRHLIIFWSAYENPVFFRETLREPTWQKLTNRLARATGVLFTLGGLTCYLNILLLLYARNLLIVLMPLLLFWTVLLGLVLGPVIVREREQRTWNTLRTTPLSIEMVVLGKAGGALWWLHGLIRIMSGVLVITAMGVGLGSLVVVFTEPGTDLIEMPSSLICSMTLALPLISAIIFMVDRLQQFVLTAVAALAVSSSASSVRGALVGASAAALVAWMADIAAAGVVLAIQTQQVIASVQTRYLTLATLGPTIGYLAELPFWEAVVGIAVTLVVRELVIQILWRWTIYAARSL